MRIGIVGGVERTESAYREVASRLGLEVVFHSGHVGGRGAANLVELVAGVELVIVLTDVNSHGAVTLARRSARRLGKPVELHRRYSPSRLAARVGAEAVAR